MSETLSTLQRAVLEGQARDAAAAVARLAQLLGRQKTVLFVADQAWQCHIQSLQTFDSGLQHGKISLEQCQELLGIELT